MEVASIYTKFHQGLLTFIRSKIRSKEDAEDILQNVFIRISSNVNTLSDKDKLQSWVFTITRNAIIDYYRSTAARKNLALDSVLDESLVDDIPVDSTQGLDQCIGHMIDLLPAEYRDIVIDSEINGIRQKDLAVKYRMAYPSMRSRVQRGRERLKQLFYNCCYIETDRHGNVLEAKGRSNCNVSCNPGDSILS